VPTLRGEGPGDAVLRKFNCSDPDNLVDYSGDRWYFFKEIESYYI
jgi:hypothetical protein